MKVKEIKPSFIQSLVCAFLLCSGLPAFGQNNGSTGNPVNWVQVGQTKDTILQIDANSILGFNGKLGLAHRTDFRFKGKVDDKLTSQTKTALMLQEDCDKGQGNLAIFFTNSDGQPSGKGDTYSFNLRGEDWADAIARGLCKARQISMDNNAAQKKPNRSDETSTLNSNKEPREVALNDTEKLVFERYKVMAFCAGFTKELFPDNSASHCNGQGMINQAKCDSYLVNNWYGDAMNPKYMPSAKFAEYIKQNKKIFENEESRGWNSSAKRQQNPKNFQDATEKCRNYIDSMKQAIRNMK